MSRNATSIRTALKSMKHLISLDINFPSGLFLNHFDLCCIPPGVRYLSLGNVHIESSSTCKSTHLELLILNECYLNEVYCEIPDMFGSVKKCYFRVVKRSVAGFKKLLGIVALGLIVIKCSPVQFKEMEKISSNYGVPSHSESFALERTGELWKYVNLSEECAEDIIREVYTGGIGMEALDMRV